MKTQFYSVAIAILALAATTQSATANSKLVERSKSIDKLYETVTFEDKHALNTEAGVTFEKWMTDETFWHLNTKSEIEDEVQTLNKLVLEPWMSSDETFKIQQIEKQSKLEKWMLDNKLWRFEI